MAEFPLLLEPELLAEQLASRGHPTDVLIIEQAPLDMYLAGHIPGSVHVDFKRLQYGQPPTPGALPTAEQLSQLFSELGLTPTTHVICSDHEGGGWAGRLIWVLDCIGHRHYSYLNGGLTAWQQAGLPTTTEAVSRQPSQYQAKVDDTDCSIHKDALSALLSSPELAIWDARSLAEYDGSKAISSRGGHIPGAVHYEWTRAMDPANGLRLRPLETLRAELQQLGIEPGKQVVTHCQSHHRSGLTYLIGKLLQLSIQAYPGSWAEWGNDSQLPIAQGQSPRETL
ncbi:thiosulfate sulfurtransferase [Bacterioplanes sanyensis]|uniref:Thiosulfate sulfurtransferase n=1 Tax=Bacterioplanes sanyensis TaxID=1249553 RepID=A0A222FIM5_9GAMM|nr:rhodanese-like domain-containing protein [Bacterioplanes sanyensis]ASP38885.1 thiosulfate sulfurtransferase [Bacterioplanes sanyensis]